MMAYAAVEAERAVKRAAAMPGAASEAAGVALGHEQATANGGCAASGFECSLRDRSIRVRERPHA